MKADQGIIQGLTDEQDVHHQELERLKARLKELTSTNQ